MVIYQYGWGKMKKQLNLYFYYDYDRILKFKTLLCILYGSKLNKEYIYFCTFDMLVLFY